MRKPATSQASAAMMARIPFTVASGAGKIYKETLRLQWKRTINRMLPCVRLKTQVRMIERATINTAKMR